MIHTDHLQRVTLRGIPRESGDDPSEMIALIKEAQYSPRERG